jgi:outer membrane immunogenic protein
MQNAITHVGLIFAVAAASFTARVANAGDISDKSNPPFVWAGFYGGINSGYGWDAGNNGSALEPLVGQNTTFAPYGGMGGGQIGYNMQVDRIVYGLEADCDAAQIADDYNGNTLRSKLSWLTTVRARAGYLYGDALIYMTGGFAAGGVKNLVTTNLVFRNDDAQTGYALGGGVEYRVAQAWSFRLEYQYVSLGHGALHNGDVSLPSNPYVNDYAIVKLGINYFLPQRYDAFK